jgi:Holliday junction resolvase
MTPTDNIDNKARTIQNIANELGWNSDLPSLIERVKQMDNGLVQEDEFLYILDWADKCSLVHKLDQLHIPPTSKKKYSIPDLFVVFNDKGKKTPYFIEIKTSKNDSLSWTETYYNGFINYANETGIPVLVAWKWNSLGIWTLFELKHFKKNVSNFKIDLNKAMQETLMSKLVGDYFIVPYDEIGIHFKMKKEKMVDKKGDETLWQTVIEDVYLTGNEGKEITDIDSAMFAFVFSLPMESKVTVTETHIINSFTPSHNKSSYAQSVPIRLARAFANNEEVNWLTMIKNQNYSIKHNKLFDALEKGIGKEIIRNIFFIQPKSEGL